MDNAQVLDTYTPGVVKTVALLHLVCTSWSKLLLVDTDTQQDYVEHACWHVCLPTLCNEQYVPDCSVSHWGLLFKLNMTYAACCQCSQ
jgi:hypothetical protein